MLDSKGLIAADVDQVATGQTLKDAQRQFGWEATSDAETARLLSGGIRDLYV